MSDEFEQAKSAIARVTVADNQRAGTAFYIGDGYALTALHVVADIDEAPPKFLPDIRLRFPNTDADIDATLVEDFWSVDGDWAVLKCAPHPPLNGIQLGVDVARDQPWRSYGYPEIEPAGMTLGGTLRDPSYRQLQQPETGTLLQLLSDEASAGMGAPLHGFSGAPCLVGRKAVGILRRTLVKDVTDGELRQHVFTQGGTAYATPSQQLVQWQVEHRRSVLPGTWAPPEMVLEDFLVVLSSQEPRPDDAVGKEKRLALRDVVNVARKRLAQGALSKPFFVHTADMIATRDALEECVAALCRAKVVIFDASGFEPATMLLAGIRAVCRRGVTLLSVGGNVALGEELSVPFNIKDANIVVHSLAQNEQSTGSVMLLADRLGRGLREIDSPQYLDLPVYEAVRLLPPDRRGIIPNEEGVLVLCAFDSRFRNFWSTKLSKALDNELVALRESKGLIGPASIGVARSFELASPRLVTQAVYEAIRRMQSCVIDLTGWSPSVMFELGVRLAASGERSVCIIDSRWQENLPSCDEAQVRSLVSLLVSDEFMYDRAQPWEAQDVFRYAYGVEPLPPPPLLREGALHALIERVLDIDTEPASRPVYIELLGQAALFSRSAGVGGRSKPIGLFPGNSKLTQREEEAEFERLVAVWLYLAHRYERNELLASEALCKALDEVITALFGRHKSRLNEAMQNELNELFDSVEDGRV